MTIPSNVRNWIVLKSDGINHSELKVFVTAFCTAVMALCVVCVLEVLELDAVGAAKLRSDERLELLEFDELEELEELENNEARVLFTTVFAFSTSCAA